MSKRTEISIISLVLILAMGASGVTFVKPMACASLKSSASCCSEKAQDQDSCSPANAGRSIPKFSSPKQCCCPALSAQDKRIDELLPEYRGKIQSGASLSPVSVYSLVNACTNVFRKNHLPPNLPLTSQERAALLQIFLI
jgi:hypothetical protein